MLDTAGKLFEKLLQPRLLKAIEEAGGLSQRQHGFRKGHSTIHAIASVVDTIERAQSVNHHSRKLTLLAILDVKNAFNSARWSDMLNALERRFKLPVYLMSVMKNYLKDRTLLYDTDQGQRTKALSGGAAQGSILGPYLWNVTYDDLLRLEMPRDTELVAYADDVGVLITAHTVEEAQRHLNEAMRRVKRWMNEHSCHLQKQRPKSLFLQGNVYRRVSHSGSEKQIFKLHQV